MAGGLDRRWNGAKRAKRWDVQPEAEPVQPYIHIYIYMYEGLFVFPFLRVPGSMEGLLCMGGTLADMTRERCGLRHTSWRHSWRTRISQPCNLPGKDIGAEGVVRLMKL